MPQVNEFLIRNTIKNALGVDETSAVERVCHEVPHFTCAEIRQSLANVVADECLVYSV